MTARRKQLFSRVEESLKELRVQRIQDELREWRDEAGKDRAILFGHLEEPLGKLPHFVVLVERLDGSRTRSRKFRGRDVEDAGSQALQALRSES